jgi:superfamily II DNA/RNA helicase
MSNLHLIPNLHPRLKIGIESYETLSITPRQHDVLNTLTSSSDVVILGGSTSCYETNLITYISALNKVQIESKGLQLVFIKPTRELVRNSALQFKKIAKFMELNVFDVYGQIFDAKELEKCHVLFITPGRLVDLIRRRLVSFESLVMLIVDRVEDIYYRLSTDFIEEIFNFTNIKTQFVVVFEYKSIEENLKPLVNSMKSPVIVSIGEKEKNLCIESSISHYYIFNSGSDTKLEIVRDLNEEISNCCEWGIANAEDQEFDELCKLFREIGCKFKSVELTYKLEKSYDQSINCLLINTSAISTPNRDKERILDQLKIIVNYALPSSIQYSAQCRLFNVKGSIIVINIVNSEDYNNFNDLERDCNIKIKDLDQELMDLIK